ncbi:MAG: type III pantothenate kinase [Gammaproteobacteria bacterium]|nr:type III pantothenate kinase [Gammaproteobacteria bacterium]
MILLIDAGNSRLKWAILRNGQFEQGGVMAQSGNAIKEMASAAWGDLGSPDAVMVANVAGEPFRRALNSWVKRHWKLTPDYVVATADQFGVVNAYAEPERLGIDRWLALLAARELQSGALCVIDCGTALTIDVLTQDDKHLGGLIVPGIQLMRDALAGRSEVIRLQIEQATPQQVTLLGTDTGSAVSGGTLYAAVALIDRILADLRSEFGSQLHCILTGGDVPQLQPLLSQTTRFEADLVLLGLARIARLKHTDKLQPDSVSAPDASAAAEAQE